MQIQILGTGCARCQKLAANAEAAARAADLDYEIVKITDPKEIIKFGVMLTPALAIDGEVKCAGAVPSVAQIGAYLG